MLNEEQARYIENLRQNYPGLPVDQLSGTLRSSGWSDEQIASAMLEYGASATPVVVPPPIVETIVQTVAPAAALASSSTPSPTPNVFPSTTAASSRKWFVVAGVMVLVLLVGGGSVFAYMQGWLSFGGKPLTDISQKSLLSGIFLRLGDVRSASYELAGDVAVRPREAGAMPFGNQNLDPSALLPYQRDQDRFRDIEKIKNAMPKNDLYGGNVYDQKLKKFVPKPVAPFEYPDNLASLPNVPAKDPQGDPYVYVRSPDKKDFTLSVTFETREAYEVASRSEKNGDKKFTVSFTESELTYFSAYSFKGKPKAPSLFGMADYESMMQYMPTELSGHLALFGTFTRQEEDALPDGQFKIEASGSMGDASMSFDAEMLKKAEAYFGRLNKSPELFGAVGKIKGKWIRITEADLRESGYLENMADYLPSEKSKQEEAKRKLFEGMNVILQIADEEKVLIESAPTEKVVVDTKPQELHHLMIDRKMIAPFYKKVIKFLEASTSTASSGIFKFEQSLVDYLESEEFATSFDYLAENNTFSVWTDEAGFPVKIAYRMRVIPSDEVINMKGKQFELTLTASLKNINVPVKVVAPEGAISFDGLMMELSGKTREELQLERQVSNVESVRNALGDYEQSAGVYPESLDDLTKNRKDIPKKPAGQEGSVVPAYRGVGASDFETRIGLTPLLKSLPLDVVTQKTFGYQRAGTDYTLQYSVNLPPYRDGINTYAIFSADYDYSASETNGMSKKKFVLHLVNGVNTANKDEKSLEAKKQSAVDKDGDTLADAIEVYIGTNPSKKDSDGDSYSDGEEVSEGNNPLGPGKMKSTSNQYGGFLGF